MNRYFLLILGSISLAPAVYSGDFVALGECAKNLREKLTLEDAMRVGVTRNQKLIDRFISDLKRRIYPLAYDKWHKLDGGIEIRLKAAGHVLGSAIVEVQHRRGAFRQNVRRRRAAAGG